MSLYQHIVVLEKDIATMSTMATMATMQIPDTLHYWFVLDFFEKV